MDPDDLARLRRLLDDYARADRRHAGLLAEIDELLTRALADLIRPGIQPEEVRRALGDPHVVLGEESDERLDWLYPALPPAGTPADGMPWYVMLRFRNGTLARAERRAWVEAR